jgi:ATP-dependent helicase/nuclease subunit B
MLVDGAGFGDLLENRRLVEIARRIDKPTSPPKAIEPPAPKPPLAVRPRALPVTQVELWLRDPYALYAKKILNLRKLDPIDMAPAAAERGSVIHDALDRFVKLYPGALPGEQEALGALMRCGQEAFGDLLDQPGVRGFWWPRYERIAKWFLTFERERRVRAGTVLAEQVGTLAIPAPGGIFTLSAKADRIELLGNGVIAIADYKTGTPPTAPQVMSGLNPQLTLEAAIALEGGFPGIAAATVDELVYIALKGAAVAGDEQILDFAKSDPDAEAATAKAGLQRFVSQFDSPDTAYLSKPRVLLERYAGDYDHLARVKEWSSGDDE